MAIDYVGGQVAGRTNPTSALSVNFALTGGLASVPAAGDLVVVTCVTGSAAGNPAMAVTTPATYIALGQLNQSAVTADTSMDVSYKFMPATPDTAVTIPGTGNNAFGEAYSIQVFRGVDPTTPMDVTPVSAGGTGTGRPNPGSINWATAGTWTVICGGGAAGTGAVYVAPANYTTDFVTANGVDTTDAMVGSGYNSAPADPEDPAVYTGGTTGANDSWTAYTLALRPAADAVSVGVTGEASTGGFGSFAAAVVLALSGVFGTGAVGPLSPSATMAISGEAAAGGVGTLVPSSAYSAALAGVAGTGAPGSIAASVSVALTGNAATGAVGTLIPSSGIDVALGGNAASGAIGNLAASISAGLPGDAGTGAVGTVVPSAGFNVALAGNIGTGDIGSIGASVSRALAGNAASGSVGSVVPSSALSVSVGGNAATSAVGSVAAGASVALVGEGAPGGVGSVGIASGPVVVPLTGNQAITTAGVLTPSAFDGMHPDSDPITGTPWAPVSR